MKKERFCPSHFAFLFFLRSICIVHGCIPFVSVFLGHRRDTWKLRSWVLADLCPPVSFKFVAFPHFSLRCICACVCRATWVSIALFAGISTSNWKRKMGRYVLYLAPPSFSQKEEYCRTFWFFADFHILVSRVRMLERNC